MPIIRKLLKIGNSKAITIPKSWLLNAEETAGKKVVGVALEVTSSIILQPIFEKTTKEIKCSASE